MARTAAARTPPPRTPLPQTQRAATRLAAAAPTALARWVPTALARRVYRREIYEALGYSITWFLKLQRDGVIPRGHRDHSAGREWYTEDEARKIIDKMNKRGRA